MCEGKGSDPLNTLLATVKGRCLSFAEPPKLDNVSIIFVPNESTRMVVYRNVKFATRLEYTERVM